MICLVQRLTQLNGIGLNGFNFITNSYVSIQLKHIHIHVNITSSLLPNQNTSTMLDTAKYLSKTGISTKSALDIHVQGFFPQTFVISFIVRYIGCHSFILNVKRIYVDKHLPSPLYNLTGVICLYSLGPNKIYKNKIHTCNLPTIIS